MARKRVVRKAARRRTAEGRPGLEAEGARERELLRRARRKAAATAPPRKKPAVKTGIPTPAEQRAAWLEREKGLGGRKPAPIPRQPPTIRGRPRPGSQLPPVHAPFKKQPPKRGPSTGTPGGIKGGRKTQPKRTTAAEPPKGLSQVKRTRPKPAKPAAAAKPKVRRKRRTIRQRGRTRTRRT